jgi:hypothetical protein
MERIGNREKFIVNSSFRILGCVSLFSLATCATFRGYPDQVVTTSDAKSEMTGYIGPTGADMAPCVASPTALCRNQIIDAQVFVIDAEYNDFIRDLNQSSGLTNLTTDAITLTLGGLGATIGGTATKAALAAAATGVTGISNAYSKDVLAQQTAAAIITQMDALRAKAKTTIVTGEKETITNYTLQQGLDDVLAYQAAGSVPAAVQQISSNASNNKTDADKKLLEAIQ